MGASSATLHESQDRLDAATVDRHRAIVSLMEELEAVDWYNQRVDAAGDDELREILAHNRDEEKEHAMMLLEWLRRNMPGFDQQIRTYLMTEGPIAGVEVAATGGTGGGAGGTAASPASAGAGDGSLGIGSLRGEAGR